MTERSLTGIYTELITETLRVIGGASMLPRTDELHALHAAVIERATTPAEGDPLITDIEVWLAQSLIRIEQARVDKQPNRERLWKQLAGVLLPEVQADAYEALLAQMKRNTRPATTDQDYAGRTR